jgi:hypothetical protein
LDSNNIATFLNRVAIVIIIASLSIAWSIAEIEAAATGFPAILPNHFWIGCCKGCDLDYAKLLHNAKPEMQKQQSQIAKDFLNVRDALAAERRKVPVIYYCTPTSRRSGRKADCTKSGESRRGLPCLIDWDILFS